MKIEQLFEHKKGVKAVKYTSKPRDPNTKTMQGIRSSGAAGAHKDKKKAAKQGDVKHKGKEVAEGGVVDTVKSVATKVGDALSNALPKDMRPFDYDTAAKASAAQKENNELEIHPGTMSAVEEDWQKVNKSDKTDGMSSKAVKAYRRENPGSKLKTAVTTKPSKLKKGSKSAKRRKSFCARMSGMKKAHASAKTKRDPDSPINKALRRWNCESVEDMRMLIEHAERVITEEKKGLYYYVNKRKKADTSRSKNHPDAPSEQDWKDAAKTAKKESVSEDSENRCMQCGMKNCKCPGDSCKCKPIAGWEPGKGFKKAMEEAALNEKWSQKYKSSINCSHPKGFSQKAHCAGKKKHNESMEMEMVCPDCGMCESHGNLNEIKKGQKDSNGFTKCWPGKHAEGTKKGKNGGQVRNCVPNESVSQDDKDFGDKYDSEVDTVRHLTNQDGKPGYVEKTVTVDTNPEGKKRQTATVDVDGKTTVNRKYMKENSLKGLAESIISEMTRNPDLMSQGDYDRYQQSQMDYEKRAFKRQEMEHELGDEDRGMYYVVIAKNGKWEYTKAQPRQEGMNAAQRVINSLHAKYPSMHLGMMGPDGKVYNMGKGK